MGSRIVRCCCVDVPDKRDDDVCTLIMSVGTK